VMTPDDIGADFPLRDALPESAAYLPSGGSAIAGPDGRFIVEPRAHEPGLIIAELELDAVLRERHNLDVAGHYHRGDVFRLEVDRSRREPVKFVEGGTSDLGHEAPP
jgi:nitrilase